MQSYYPEQFEREMSCTEAEWLHWLGAALGACPYVLGDGFVRAQFVPGSLNLRWCVVAPLRVALIRMPRLRVRFEFDGLDELRRQQFMRRFDLYMLRGGG
jgi:hypothetical protein